MLPTQTNIKSKISYKYKKVYKHTLFVFIFSLCILFSVNGQKILATDVVIFGTRHSPNSVYNSDSLVKAALSIKPDVILIESDSTSYYFKTGVFRPLPGLSLYLKRIGLRSKLDPEDDMLHRLHREFPHVVIKPHDVAFNGAERMRYRRELIQLEIDFDDAMSKAYDRNEMTDYRANVHVLWRHLRSSFWQLMDSTLQVFNSDSTTEFVRQLETLEATHFRALVDSVPSLQPFNKRVNLSLQHSNYRDEVMVQQILRYIKEYRGKRIIVLVGFFHRYYQLDKLAPKSEQLNFRLLDINGVEMTFPAQITPWIKN